MPTPLFNLLEVESKLFSWLHDTHPFVKRGARHAVARGDVLTCAAGSASSARISRICLSFSLSLRPPTRPRARAAVRAARVRSRIRFRSNSAKAANTWNWSLPEALPVSIFSLRLSKVMPPYSRSPMIFTRSDNERPRRSSRHTTRVSPARSALRQCSSSTRCDDLPEAVSS